MSNEPDQTHNASEVPTVDAASVLIGSEMEPPGSRTPEYLSRVGYKQRPRSNEPREFLAELVRGVSWTLSYLNQAVVFQKGRQVPVSASEKTRLEEEGVDLVTFNEPFGGRVQRTVPKFIFYDFTTRKKLPPKQYADVQLDAAPVADAFAAAQHEAEMVGMAEAAD